MWGGPLWSPLRMLMGFSSIDAYWATTRVTLTFRWSLDYNIIDLERKKEGVEGADSDVIWVVTEGCVILVVCPPCLETDELVYFLSKEIHFFGLSPASPLTAQLNNLVARLVGDPFQSKSRVDTCFSSRRSCPPPTRVEGCWGSSLLISVNCLHSRSFSLTLS
jgi:hypothetical protein